MGPKLRPPNRQSDEGDAPAVLRDAGRRDSEYVKEELLVNLAEGATVISPDRRHSMTFDREGRLHFYFRQGCTFKRSLGSDLHLRFQRQGRRRRQLPPAEAASIFAEVYAKAREIEGYADGRLRSRLREEILRWSAESLARERERFLATYRPVSILPPDQYLSIVLQATEGCSWNQCSFCSFYMDRPFRVKSPAEFEDHVAGVKELLGTGLKLRRGIFLADGNALALSMSRLQPLVEIAVQVFPGRPLFGFVDLFSGERRPSSHWEGLARMGLERVYIGMETGLDELLKAVNKPGSAAELVEFVTELKRTSLSVCLILLIGLGGREYRTEHSRASLEVLGRLPLGDGDLVYLSPLVESPAALERRRLAGQTSFTPMDEDEIETELHRLASEVRRLGIKTSRYDIREFIY